MADIPRNTQLYALAACNALLLLHNCAFTYCESKANLQACAVVSAEPPGATSSSIPALLCSAIAGRTAAAVPRYMHLIAMQALL